jgi:hypothetical protein
MSFAQFAQQSTAQTPAQNVSSPATATPGQPPNPSTTVPPQASNAFSMPSSFTSTGSGSAAMMRLREVAAQSQKLNETTRAGSTELPKLELSLGMIREKARDLSRRAGGASRENMQQAYNFFIHSLKA